MVTHSRRHKCQSAQFDFDFPFPKLRSCIMFYNKLNFAGLLRLQAIYQGMRLGNESFQVEMVKRITGVSSAIEFLKTLESLSRWTPKYIVLDCSTDTAKSIIVSHVRDVSLGRRTYHYLLSGLVSSILPQYYVLRISLVGCCSSPFAHSPTRSSPTVTTARRSRVKCIFSAI